MIDKMFLDDLHLYISRRKSSWQDTLLRCNAPTERPSLRYRRMKFSYRKPLQASSNLRLEMLHPISTARRPSQEIIASHSFLRSAITRLSDIFAPKIYLQRRRARK